LFKKLEKVCTVTSENFRSVAPNQCASNRNCVFHSSLSSFLTK